MEHALKRQIIKDMAASTLLSQMANFGKFTPHVIRTLALPFEKGDLMKSQRLLIDGQH